MLYWPPTRPTIYASLYNFRTPGQELDFGDFTIITLEPGPETAEWNKRLQSRFVPRNLLIKESPGHRSEDDGMSGYDTIIDDVYELVRILRLFKVGDIMLSDIMIQDGQESLRTLYSPARPSSFKYRLDSSEVDSFRAFRTKTIGKPGYRNKFCEFFLNYFMAGVDKGFSYNRIDRWGKIVDYVTALESFFLIDDPPFFLGRSLRERVSRFLGNESARQLVKYMYNERSRFVHGGNIDLTEAEKSGKVERMRTHMPPFEELMREVANKVLTYDFSERGEIIQFVKGLFVVSAQVTETMKKAKEQAEKRLSS